MAPSLTGSSLIPASANWRIGFHETHPLFAACRHPAVRQRPRGYAEVEERQGEPRLPARAAERSRQEHQGRARRIRPGRIDAPATGKPGVAPDRDAKSPQTDLASKPVTPGDSIDPNIGRASGDQADAPR